jgi:hypothetical protein
MLLMAKKRRSDPTLWQRNIRKEKVNKGLAYVNSNKINVQPKSVQKPCPPTCRLKCSEKITCGQREEIFRSFWVSGQKPLQWNYIANHIVNSRAIIHRSGSKRLITKHYFLSLPPSEAHVSPTRMRVCQKFFLSTLNVSPKTVETAQAKFGRNNATVSPDGRGKYERPHSPKTLEMRNAVLEHINQFPKVPSHYCRADSTKIYVDSSLSVAIMYRLYVEWLPKVTSKASQRQYRDIFGELNIGFHQPKKDQCNMCYGFNLTPAENRTQQQSDAQKQHLLNRNLSRAIKQEAKSASQVDKTKVSACFDFQKILSSPQGEASLLYYKRKLSIYNFTVFDMGSNIGTCFVWDETVGGRGCNEVGSCLINWMEEHVAKGAKEFSFFSDNCAGQNRNRFVFGAYAYFAKKYGVSIQHSFLEAGHTQNEADSVHALIERRKKHKEVFVPAQWYGIMRTAKVSGHPYVVKEVDQKHIWDLKPFVFSTQWEKSQQNHKVPWSRVKVVRVDANSPHIVKFKLDYQEPEYTTVQLYSEKPAAATRKRKSKVFAIPTELTPAYNGALLISDKKFADLKELCRSGIIPSVYHAFYESLKPTDSVETECDALDEIDEFFI